MLAVGRLATRPWVRNGTLVASPTIKLTLSADHRILDGEPAAQFLERIVQYIESPIALCMKGAAA
jgi:pyruvate dehydrogenase E2 component (dihydrolipoamide acetyltransferase)